MGGGEELKRLHPSFSAWDSVAAEEVGNFHFAGLAEGDIDHEFRERVCIAVHLESIQIQVH
jgi:hypothetical protein